MDNYLGEITLFAGNFAPQGWAFCWGQILPIASNTALFSLLGTTYGGNGTTNFALPDLRARAATQQGSWAGNTAVLGEQDGATTATLLYNNMPAHTHAMQINGSAGGSTPNTYGNYLSFITASGESVVSTGATLATLNPGSVTGVGTSQPFSIVQPYLGLSFIIALNGIYPARS